MFGQFEKSVYLCTRKSDNEELNGSVAQLNRASDYRRNHKGEEIERFSLFFSIIIDFRFVLLQLYKNMRIFVPNFRYNH